ncbi:hypothetical protein [Mesorhizobium amorphae]|uniref:hypothetical protein n=1 Tax=Mesorhizobium amorphae TaxID=71433 RepID=UPI0011864D23|nr:hypothetical protein [Mesorhizobium amorphae]
MPATTTAAVACPSGSWTEIVDGAVNASCVVQVAGATPLAIAFSASAPAVATNDFILLQQGGQVSIAATLDAVDSVWGKGLSADAVARVVRTARS